MKLLFICECLEFNLKIMKFIGSNVSDTCNMKCTAVPRLPSPE